MSIDEVKLSDFRISFIAGGKSPCGFASFVINDTLKVTGVAIHQRVDGSYYLIFPDKFMRNGERVQVLYPVSDEAEKLITGVVVDAYHKEYEKRRV